MLSRCIGFGSYEQILSDSEQGCPEPYTPELLLSQLDKGDTS